MVIKIFSLRSALFSIALFISIFHLQAQNKTQHTLLKTKSGLLYQIFPGKGGEKPKSGEFVKFAFRYTVAPTDSLLQSSFGRIPSYAKVDTGQKAAFSFMEIVPKLSVGDSAEIIINVDSLVKKKLVANYNSVFKQGGSLVFRIKLLQIFKSDSAIQEDYTKETELEKDREVKNIEQYMTQKGISGKETKDGAFVVIENAGDTTLKADSGMLASIKYKGYLFNGNVFDTNMDSSKGHTDPIDVTVGKQQVIKGWEEGLPYFGKGGKGKILIPAMLAYGTRAMGPDLPAYSDLIFDIEILDVKPAP